MSVRVQAEDFSLQREYDEVLAEAGDAGAVAKVKRQAGTDHARS